MLNDNFIKVLMCINPFPMSKQPLIQTKKGSFYNITAQSLN